MEAGTQIIFYLAAVVCFAVAAVLAWPDRARSLVNVGFVLVTIVLLANAIDAA